MAGLGALGRREWLKPLTARLAEAALRVQPSADYFVIERGGRIVGGGAHEIDTTGFTIITRDRLFGQLVEGDTENVILRARSIYTPRLAFHGLKVEVELGPDSLALSAERGRDSLLLVRLDGLPTRSAPESIAAADPIFLPTTAGMPLALLSRLKVGKNTDVRIFDPWLQRARYLQLRVTAESLFVVTDSAAFDPLRARWAPARSDTVRAWLVVTDSSAVKAWLDVAGRPVQISDGRGTIARRTAYEIAYENWRIAREKQRSVASPASGSPTITRRR